MILKPFKVHSPDGKTFYEGEAPQAAPVPQDGDELAEDPQEAREILENMVRSIELDGNYSTEATCTFLRQALLCLPAALASNKAAAVAPPGIAEISDSRVEQFWNTYNEATQFKSMIEATKVALASIATHPAAAQPSRAEVLELLREVASRKRYNPNAMHGKTFGTLTLNMPVELLERIDAALGDKP